MSTTPEGTNSSPSSIAQIAVGVDGYPEGKDAVVLGATLARAANAELILVAVHPYPLVVLPEEANWKSLERQAASLLRDPRDSRAPDARIVVETDVSVPRAVACAVAREDCDLLVVGSSRHGTEGRVRIGKRTRQLLCHFTCPLAIAPRGTQNKAGPELRRIGVGFDGGGESEAALARAGSIARLVGAELRLCGVIDDRVPSPGWWALDSHNIDVQRSEEVVQSEWTHFGNSRAAAPKRRAPARRPRSCAARPADALLNLSETVDLLVIGSRRWGPRRSAAARKHGRSAGS
jgi:nucleotide-binding universal stress UspA family protein